MYVMSTFDQSEFLELAITKLQQDGIPKEHILAVPLDLSQKQQGLGDTIHYSDGKSFLDVAALVSTFFGSLGTIIGFGLPWGPVVWGIGGFLFGGILGFIVNYIMARKKYNAQINPKKKFGEVILTVYCSNSEASLVEDTLWKHFAIGVARLDLSKNES